jgi:hypothetical protein
MKTPRFVPLILLAAAFGASAQPQDISGTWAGALSVAPDASLDIHFVLSRSTDGGYSAVVTSPDTGAIKDVPASSVGFESGRLTLTVDALNGAYEGTFENGGFTGEWRQEGQALPLRLEPYAAPVLSQAAQDLLSGSWVGTITGPGGSVTIVYRFEIDDAGRFVGYLDSPDEGARGIAMDDIRFDDGRLSLRIPRAQVEYSATISGDEMSGTWKQLTAEVPLSLNRGAYELPETNLSADAMARLEGSWLGTIESPAGPLATVFRFETNDAGDFVGFFEHPEQGLRGRPITEIALDGEALRLRVPALGAEYTGTLAGGRMQGSLIQGPQTRALSLEPGTFTPTRTPLELSTAAMERLAGVWRGRLGPVEVLLRFETADGVAYGSLAVPAQGVDGLSVTSATLAADELTLGIAPLRVELTATLTGDELAGRWQQGPGNVVPVTFTRD